MPGPLLRDPGTLRDPGPLRSGNYDRAYNQMQQESVEVAAEEFNQELLKTTRIPLPDPVLPVDKGTLVFESEESFTRAQQEASTLADTTPLGPFTPYRPGFKADTTLKTTPPVRAPAILDRASPSTRREPSMFTSVSINDRTAQVKRSYREAIASIESRGGGDYRAIGPKDPELGRALGRYQVMEANVGPWTKAALGRELTPEQFLLNPKAQDIVFDHIFGNYVERFGSPEKAAQAWFAGPGGVGRVTREDVLGTSVGEYGRKFQKALKTNR